MRVSLTGVSRRQTMFGATIERRSCCVSLLCAVIAITSSSIAPVEAALSVEASFNDSRCGDGRAVCPDNPLLFTCTITDSPVVLATVRLPSGQRVNIDEDNTISVEGVLPAGVTIQSHNAMVDGTLRNYTLSLAFERASLLTGSVILCDSRFSSFLEEVTCPIANGPAPPEGLVQNVPSNTESSAVVQWRAPVSTGGSGVSISRYTLTVEGQMPVDVSGTMLTHIISGLDYNTSYSVAVTAINSCGLSSQPATTSIYIEARVPPPTSCSCMDSREEVIGVTAAISITITLLLALPVGVVIGCYGMWYTMKKRGGGEKREQAAYGQVSSQG